MMAINNAFKKFPKETISKKKESFLSKVLRKKCLQVVLGTLTLQMPLTTS